MNGVNVFTCCNYKYSDFSPMFILSNLYHIKNSFVEVCIDSKDSELLKLIPNSLYELYPNRFLVRLIDSNNFGVPGITRFITTPQVKKDYIYISDIDIINMTNNICEIHLNIMNDEELPYSNMVRENSMRLTGLHFSPWHNYYPIQDYDDIRDYANQDEEFLYQLMKKRFPTLINNNKKRPVHGIHMSPNRDPHSTKIHWGISDVWKDTWIQFRNSKEFSLVYPSLSDRLKTNIKIIDERYTM